MPSEVTMAVRTETNGSHEAYSSLDFDHFGPMKPADHSRFANARRTKIEIRFVHETSSLPLATLDWLGVVKKNPGTRIANYTCSGRHFSKHTRCETFLFK